MQEVLEHDCADIVVAVAYLANPGGRQATQLADKPGRHHQIKGVLREAVFSVWTFFSCGIPQGGCAIRMICFEITITYISEKNTCYKKQFFAMSDYLIFEMLFSICNLYFEGDIICHFLVLVSLLFAGCDQKNKQKKNIWSKHLNRRTRPFHHIRAPSFHVAEIFNIDQGLQGYARFSKILISFARF